MFANHNSIHFIMPSTGWKDVHKLTSEGMSPAQALVYTFGQEECWTHKLEKEVDDYVKATWTQRIHLVHELTSKDLPYAQALADTFGRERCWPSALREKVFYFVEALDDDVGKPLAEHYLDWYPYTTLSRFYKKKRRSDTL